MILPSRRWLVVAACLALVALLALTWAGGGAALLAVDALWIAALVVDAWRVSRPAPAELTPIRDAPPAWSVGRPLPVVYRWPNPLEYRVTMLVRETLPSFARWSGGERRVTLAPGGPTAEPLTLEPLRRGKGQAGPLHLRLLGPWGLAWRQVRLAGRWPVTVYPPLRGVPVKALLTPTERRRQAGLRAVRRLGEGRLFESLREWVPGDDTRTIDWKATARRGKVMARQYEDERRQHVMLVVDAGRMLTAETAERSRLDDAVDAVLHLAVAAIDHDDDVGLMIFSDTVERYLAPARGQRALRAILEALAGADGRLVESDYPGAFGYLAARSRKRAFTVVFTDVIDRTASEALIANTASLRPRHLPLAVAIRDAALERLALTRPPDQDTAFRRAAADALLDTRAEALSELRHRGVLVLDVPPEGAARSVVELYERLKRAGRT